MHHQKLIACLVANPQLAAFYPTDRGFDKGAFRQMETYWAFLRPDEKSDLKSAWVLAFEGDLKSQTPTFEMLSLLTTQSPIARLISDALQQIPFESSSYVDPMLALTQLKGIPNEKGSIPHNIARRVVLGIIGSIKQQILVNPYQYAEVLCTLFDLQSSLNTHRLVANLIKTHIFDLSELRLIVSFFLKHPGLKTANNPKSAISEMLFNQLPAPLYGKDLSRHHSKTYCYLGVFVDRCGIRYWAYETKCGNSTRYLVAKSRQPATVLIDPRFVVLPNTHRLTDYQRHARAWFSSPDFDDYCIRRVLDPINKPVLPASVQSNTDRPQLPQDSNESELESRDDKTVSFLSQVIQELRVSGTINSDPYVLGNEYVKRAFKNGKRPVPPNNMTVTTLLGDHVSPRVLKRTLNYFKSFRDEYLRLEAMGVGSDDAFIAYVARYKQTELGRDIDTQRTLFPQILAPLLKSVAVFEPPKGRAISTVLSDSPRNNRLMSENWGKNRCLIVILSKHPSVLGWQVCINSLRFDVVSDTIDLGNDRVITATNPTRPEVRIVIKLDIPTNTLCFASAPEQLAQSLLVNDAGGMAKLKLIPRKDITPTGLPKPSKTPMDYLVFQLVAIGIGAVGICMVYLLSLWTRPRADINRDDINRDDVLEGDQAFIHEGCHFAIENYRYKNGVYIAEKMNMTCLNNRQPAIQLFSNWSEDQYDEYATQKKDIYTSEDKETFFLNWRINRMTNFAWASYVEETSPIGQKIYKDWHVNNQWVTASQFEFYTLDGSIQSYTDYQINIQSSLEMARFLRVESPTGRVDECLDFKRDGESLYCGVFPALNDWIGKPIA